MTSRDPEWSSRNLNTLIIHIAKTADTGYIGRTFSDNLVGFLA